MKNVLWVGIAAALALGCGDDDVVTDTGPNMDAGPGDSGPSEDAATGDAAADAGPMEDAGPEDSGPPPFDAGPPTCPDLMPAQGADNVIISQYNLETGEVEFYNPTSAPIAIDGLELCSRPAYNTISDTGIMVQPGAYATYTAPASFRGANPSRGELALYDSTAYTSRNSMIDFVCWGEELAPSRSRKEVAEMAMGEEVLWEGACASSPTMNVVARGEANTGTGAADYVADQAFAPHACE